MHFPSCCPSPRVKGTCHGKAGKNGRGSAGGCRPPHATREPGEDDPPHPGKTGQDKALLRQGGGLCRDQEFKQPGSMSTPLSSWLCLQRKCTAAIEHCVCVRVCVRTYVHVCAHVCSVAQSCPTPFDPRLREAKPESHFCVATTGMRKPKERGRNDVLTPRFLIHLLQPSDIYAKFRPLRISWLWTSL